MAKVITNPLANGAPVQPADAPSATITPALAAILPGAPRVPVADISRATIWLYGEPKIGKTTLAASFPGAWFFATERGQDWVTVREPTYINNWSQFLDVCSIIDQARPTAFADGEPIRTLVIDTFDNLFKMCFDSVCAEMGVADPGEIPHGGGWSRLDREFSRVMSKIARWPYGLICISHQRSKEFKTKATKVDRMEPNVGAAGSRWANQAADLILYAFVLQEAVKDAKGQITGEIRERRVLQVHPSSSAVAGGRMADRLPAVLDLDYKELMKHFAASPAPTHNVRPALSEMRQTAD